MRVPVQPLLDWAYGPGGCVGHNNQPLGKAVAERFGVTPRTVYRWQCNPGYTISIWQADRHCAHIGLSIADIWGPAFYRELLVAS